MQGPGRTVRREGIYGAAKDQGPPEVGNLPLGVRRRLLSPLLFLTAHSYNNQLRCLFNGF